MKIDRRKFLFSSAAALIGFKFSTADLLSASLEFLKQSPCVGDNVLIQIHPSDSPESYYEELCKIHAIESDKTYGVAYRLKGGGFTPDSCRYAESGFRYADDAEADKCLKNIKVGDRIAVTRRLSHHEGMRGVVTTIKPIAYGRQALFFRDDGGMYNKCRSDGGFMAWIDDVEKV